MSHHSKLLISHVRFVCFKFCPFKSKLISRTQSVRRAAP